MADRTLRTLVALALVMGLLASLEPSWAVVAEPLPSMLPVNTLNDPIQVLSGDSNYFLKVDLRDPRVHPRVMLANNDTGGFQTLYGMKNSLQGYTQWAIVNGDLFSPRDGRPPDCPDGVNCQGCVIL